MGVHGLWQLLQSTGRPVTLDSLEGKILAVDVSLWLHRTVKGMRDKDGNPLPNAHLLGLFNRVCKLLFYRIKPVFVFDGGVPQLKKQTLAARREKKEFSEKEKGKASKDLLTNLLKSEAVRQALGQEGTLNPDVIVAQSSQPRQRDMFELPPLAEPLSGTSEVETPLDSWEERLSQRQMIEMEFQDLDELDTESEDFKSLPSEIQHEILTVLKEKRKSSLWSAISELPQDSTDFSQYQMSKLLKQNQLTAQLDKVRKNLNNENSDQFFKEQFGDDFFGENVQARKLMSEDSSHFILIKGLSQKNKQQQIEQLEQHGRLIESPQTSDQTEITSDELMLESEPEGERFNKRDGKTHKTVEIDVSDYPEMVTNRETFVHVNEGEKTKEIPVSNEMNSENEERQKLENLDKRNIPLSYDETENNVCVIEDSHNKCLSQNTTLSDDSKMSSEKTVNVGVVNDPGTLKTIKDTFLKRKCLSCDDDIYLKKQKSLDVTKSASEKEDTVMLDDDKSDVEFVNKDGEITVVSSDEERDNKHAQEEREKAFSSDAHIKDEEKHPVSSDESCDDDFIEVTIHPSKPPENLDLFPASMFEENQNGENMNAAINSIHVTNSQKTDSEVDVSFKGDSAVSFSDGITEKGIDRPWVTNDNEANMRLDSEEDVEPVDVPPKNLVNEFEGLTEAELLNMQDDLELENRNLQHERGKHARLASSITDQMYIEAQDLLQLFGIPFVVSTMEAEAQCAELDKTDQTHGTITDDSDIWLFGGKRVYKNFFNQDKTVELFTDRMVKGQLGLNREIMINLALLCGSDYTEGIQGIGPVTALEILGEFPESGIQGLKAFKSWWQNQRAGGDVHPGSKIKSKFKDLALSPGFPSLSVVEAYMEPAVDKSNEPFSWRIPDLDLLREFASEKFGWNQSRSDEVLLPVMKQVNKKDSQLGIKSFFQTEMVPAPAPMKSKRLTNAIDKLVHTTSSKSTKIEMEYKSTVTDTNEKRMQKAVEVWNRTKGKKGIKGRGKGKKVVDPDTEKHKVFVENKEVVLSESGSSEEELEGGFIREDETEKKKDVSGILRKNNIQTKREKMKKK